MYFINLSVPQKICKGLCESTRRSKTLCGSPGIWHPRFSIPWVRFAPWQILGLPQCTGEETHEQKSWSTKRRVQEYWLYPGCWIPGVHFRYETVVFVITGGVCKVCIPRNWPTPAAVTSRGKATVLEVEAVCNTARVNSLRDKATENKVCGQSPKVRHTTMRGKGPDDITHWGKT